MVAEYGLVPATDLWFIHFDMIFSCLCYLLLLYIIKTWLGRWEWLYLSFMENENTLLV